jgi:hypothetical protein
MIHRRLTSAHSLSLTIALGIPTPPQDIGNDWNRLPRLAVNKGLRLFAERSGGKHVYVDLDERMPRFNQSDAVVSHRFAEHHFTPHGYAELADVVGDALLAANVPLCARKDYNDPPRVSKLFKNSPLIPICP